MVASVVLVLEFARSASSLVDVPLRVLTGVLTGNIVAASDVGVDMMLDVDATVLAAVMTGLTVIVPASSTETVPVL